VNHRWTAILGFGLLAGSLSGFTTGVNDDVGIWPNGNINYQIRLGGSSSGALIDGASSWTTVAQAAFAEWNQHLANVQFTGQEAAEGGETEDDDVNDLFFSSTIYGDAFGGSTLAVTLTRFRGFERPLPRVEADIVFNNQSDLNWNSYRGARRFDVDDLRRVLIHELGHSLGLDHPDDVGQSVSAIMNALVSDIDTAVTDDIEGAQSLYGAPGGGGSGGGGSAADAFEVDNSAATASAIANGATQSHSIHEVGDQDWVTFTIGSNGASNFTIETDGTSGDTVISLFGPNNANTLLETNDDINQSGGDFFSRITRSSLAAGQYWLRVEEFNNNGTIAAYTIRATWTEVSSGGGSGGGATTAGGKLSNLSVRAKTGGQFGTLILGFATAGAPKQVLIRGMGPTIADFGVPDPIPDPRLDMVFDGSAFDEADDWVSESNAAQISLRGAELGAFAPTSNLEAILLRSVDPNPYTVLVRDFLDRTGEVLIEAYDADDLLAPGRLTNLSTRTEVGGAAGLLTAGFVVDGSGAITLLIRGVGPTLADFGVSGAISDPRIRVLNSDQQEVAANDDWNSSGAGDKRTAAAQVGAFNLVENSRDAALVVTLSPGAYTVLMDGFNGAAGNGLIEIYEVP
jgi:hypothetical protein